MSDIDMPNIIKVNIHSIDTEHPGDSNNCCANRLATEREDMKQETDRAKKCYTSNSTSRS